VIGKRELQQLQGEWTLDLGVIEKDYVLGWLLAGIAHHPALSRTWAFKGGTCLRKCYYETFRFSEDLDFTVIESQAADEITTTLSLG
jgi:predicted nucleotidyltransferase component of viral defense system